MLYVAVEWRLHAYLCPVEYRITPVYVKFEILAPRVAQDKAVLTQVRNVERGPLFLIALYDLQVTDLPDNALSVWCTVDVVYCSSCYARTLRNCNHSYFSDYLSLESSVLRVR